MRTRVTCVAILAMLLTACGGKPIDVGMKEIDTNVLIGPAQPNGAAGGPSEPVPVIGFPGIVQPPPIPGPPPPPAHQAACPATNPLAPITHPATASASAPPVARAYTYDQSGTYQVGTKSGVLPKTMTRRVQNVQHDSSGSGSTFDVAVPGPRGVVTTTTYHLYPDAPNAATQPGLYIDRIVTAQPGQAPMTFAPVPPLELLQFPASAGTTWSENAVDPFAHTTMSYDAEISRLGTVDACGTRLQAWGVDHTHGMLSDTVSNTSIKFDERLFLAPQYGGLSIADTLDWSGTDHSTQIDINNTTTITTEPAVPS
jgi:hypothetical protein